MKYLIRTFVLGAALGALPQTASAAEHPEGVMQLVRHIDMSPSKTLLIQAGVDADGAVLVEIARDRTLHRYPRMRAAGLLQQFDTPKARQALGQLLDDPTIQDQEVRIQALAAFVHLEKARAFDRLSMLTRDPNPQLRAAALRNLGRIDHPGKQAVLQARLADGAESVKWVKELAQRVVQQTVKAP